MLGKMYSTGIILLLAISTTMAAQIEGFWQVNKSSDLIEIRSTNDGVKAKFVNSNDWDYYERLRNNTYEDRRGNRYYLESSKKLKWQSRDGRRVIKLSKARNNDRYDGYNYGDNSTRGRNQQYDDYGNDDYGDNSRRGRNDQYDDYRNDDNYGEGYCTSSCSANCTMHRKRSYKNNGSQDGLSGTWTNRWKSTIAYVEFDGFIVRMKTNKSRKWITYRRTSSRRLIFEDKRGNTIRFKNNGELKWKRSDGRRDLEFRKRYI